MFSFPKNPALCKQWMQFVFSGQQQSFLSVFVDERFINKAQFEAGFAHLLILKDGAVPAIKDPDHDSKLQTRVDRLSAWPIITTDIKHFYDYLYRSFSKPMFR